MSVRLKKGNNHCPKGVYMAVVVWSQL